MSEREASSSSFPLFFVHQNQSPCRIVLRLESLKPNTPTNTATNTLANTPANTLANTPLMYYNLLKFNNLQMQKFNI